MNEMMNKRLRLFAAVCCSNAFLCSTRFFGMQVAAGAPFEALRIGIRFAFQHVRRDASDQRGELEGVLAAAGGHQQHGALRILIDPEIAVEGVAVET